jgi:small-conductance mechanosensitive channel
MSTTAAVKIVDSAQNGLDSFFGFLPNLLGFAVILIIGYLVAKIVKGIVRKALEAAGLDKALHNSQAGQYVEKVSPDASPARLIGSIAFWFLFVFVLSAAIGALKIPAVTAFMNQVLSYLPNVAAAVLIFVIAAALAGTVATLVQKTMGDTSTGKLVSTAVPIVVMAIATFMILNQLRIAPAIVTITYAALMGAAALGSALAFGLGGRDVASRMLEEAYDRGRVRKEEAKDDLEKGKERAQQRVQQAKGQSDGAHSPMGNTGQPAPRPSGA